MTAVLGFLRVAWPYLLAGAVGFFIAWKIQGAEIADGKAEFARYKQEQSDAARIAQARLVTENNALTKKVAESERLYWTLMQEKDNEITRLYADVAAGKRRVRVAAARCPARAPEAAPNSSVDSGAGAEFDPAYTETLSDLERRSERMKTKLDACQADLKARQ